MPDLITVLRSPTQRMCKVWKASGEIQQYDLAKWFEVSQHKISNVRDLSIFLGKLETDSRSCVIRGTPVADMDLSQHARRITDNFFDKPLHVVLIEIDNYVPVINDPLLETEDAALEYINECLPAPFQNASFHWQLSNSAGAQGKAHFLKAHLWFWLEKPYDSATLRAWAAADNLALDRSVLQTVQIHYTSEPEIEVGSTNPVTTRSGFYEGLWEGVPLEIDAEVLKIRPDGIRQREGRIEGKHDPVANWLYDHWEVWGEVPNGGLIITCPYESQHSSSRKDGDTSTCYFPAGTNGYAEGSFVCLHASCRERSRTEFLCEVGYVDAQFADLVEVTDPDSEYGGGSTLVPPFKRSKGGTIMNTLTNLEHALQHIDAGGAPIRYDRFRDSLIWSEGASSDTWTWKAIEDVDLIDLRMSMERLGFPPVKADMMRDAVKHYAKSHTVDSVTDWLASLEWDGTPRIDNFWVDHYGARQDERGYARAVGAYTWTALAGRALVPGIQADMVPVLTGGQGLGKSRGLIAMSPKPDQTAHMSFAEKEIDRTRKMRGRLIVELAELQGLRSREREEIKAWITRSYEDWTPKFHEYNTLYGRRCLVFGTTNEEDFLDDPTGERRWLPLRVGTRGGMKHIDIKAIEAVRDQLWAEAVVRFQANGIEWQEAYTLAQAEHSNFKAEDTWQDAINRWMHMPKLDGVSPYDDGKFSTLDVARGALDLPARVTKHGDLRRISKILREAGFTLGVQRVDGKPTRLWVRDRNENSS